MGNYLHFSLHFDSEAGAYLARFMGIKPKNRIKRTVSIEKELIEIFEKNNPGVKVRGGSLSDLLNYGLLLVLVSQGLIASEEV